MKMEYIGVEHEGWGVLQSCYGKEGVWDMEQNNWICPPCAWPLPRSPQSPPLADVSDCGPNHPDHRLHRQVVLGPTALLHHASLHGNNENGLQHLFMCLYCSIFVVQPVQLLQCLLVTYWSMLNLDPCCILIHVASWFMLHLDPCCFLIHVASWSLLHLDPHCILIHVASWSMLLLDPCCILIHVASWSSLHLDPRCILMTLQYI